MNAAIALTSILLSMHSSFALASQPITGLLLPGQFSAPVNSEVEEQEFVVVTASVAPWPCIALATLDKKIAIFVSKELIEKLAANADTDGYKEETRRQRE